MSRNSSYGSYLKQIKRLLLATKSGLFITTLIEKDREWCKMNQYRRHQNLRFTKKQIWQDYKGIVHFYLETKRLIQTCKFNNSPKIIGIRLGCMQISLKYADDVKPQLIKFFAGKNQKFYEHGIMTLPKRWQKMIDKNEKYLIQ